MRKRSGSGTGKYRKELYWVPERYHMEEKLPYINPLPNDMYQSKQAKF